MTKIMTDENIRIVAEHREAGRSVQWIADRLGCSTGSVAWVCLKYGIETPQNADKVLPQTRPGPRIVKRGNHQVRAFCPEEDARLLELESKGLNISEISRLMNRAPNSVRNRLMTLARHDERRQASAV